VDSNVHRGFYFYINILSPYKQSDIMISSALLILPPQGVTAKTGLKVVGFQ
jgi:hypothetical protein